MAENQAAIESTDKGPVVVVSYGLSSQTDLGKKDSPWHNASVTLSVPLNDGQDAQALADELMVQAKTFVFSELDVAVKLTDEGVMMPDLVVPEKPARSSGSKGSGGGARQSDAEKYGTIEINGTTWVDYREAKASGDKPARFPDFKSPDGKRSEWIHDKDGSVKAEYEAYV